MNRHHRPATLLAWVCGVVAAAQTATAPGAETWQVRGGTVALAFDTGTLERAGLRVSDAANRASALAENPWSPIFPIDSESTLTFNVVDGSIQGNPAGQVRFLGGLAIGTRPTQQSLQNPVLAPANGKSFDRLRIADGRGGSAGGFVLERVKIGFDPVSQTLTLHAGSVYLTPEWAQALGDATLAQRDLGKLTVQAVAAWVGGDAPAPVEAGPPVPDERVIGPDMTWCQLYGLGQFGRVADQVGLSFATTSWNVGDRDIQWFPIPNENHPFIVMNLFRLKDDRLEQIGQSWIKHGFYALGNTQCGGTCTYQSGHGPGDWLGVGCTDTYSAPLNASQNGLGPRYEVNPWTGGWEYEGSHLSQGSHSHDSVEHRLEVADADLDPAQNPSATYYAEGYYAVLDDVNVMNSAAWKPTTISGSPGGNWSFGMTGEGAPPVIGFAIDAWAGARQTMIAQQVPPIEFLSPDGRCILGAKATNLGGGLWHYEYALLNIDMDRQVGSFTVPLPSGVVATNVGFHAVLHHGEPLNAPGGVPINNDPWPATVTADSVTWSTTSNPVRWGTSYNFWFDAPSTSGDLDVTLGLFKPGTPDSLTGTTTGPTGPPPICGNGVVETGEECDPPDGVHCDAECQWICGDGVIQPGEECDPPDGTTCDDGCQRIPLCGDGFVDEGEECDPPDGEHCDPECQWICGDGVVQPGEYCDPPNGVTCDDNCQRIPTCGDGILDPGEECDPPDGVTCDENCQFMSNDFCDGAHPICPGAHDGSTTGMNNDGSASCGNSSSTPDVWYSYRPRNDGTLHLSTCSAANYDTVISVHSDCPGTIANQLACVDDACPGGGTGTDLFMPVFRGVTYYIRVAGYQGATGNFVLTLAGPLCEWTICGNGIIEPGEECDPPDGITCDELCQRIPICGDGFVDEGEECDPPDGVTCDANCQAIPHCGDGVVDPGEECDDGNTVPGDGCDANCQIEPNGADNCADATAIVDGMYAFDTRAATTDGAPAAQCNFSGYSQINADIWYCYTATTSGNLTVDTCHAADFDTKLAVYEGCVCPPTSILGCNDDAAGCGVTSLVTVPIVSGRSYLIRVGGYRAAKGTGRLTISSEHVVVGDALRGGQLWDEWWTVNQAPEPSGTHPLYPPGGQQSGSITFRCMECHGWDYKGKDGWYGSGPHYTGIRGVYGSTMSPAEMFDLVKLASGPNGHGFGAYGLNDVDIWDLVEFMQTRVIDTAEYITPAAQFLGDPEYGQIHYEQDGTIACVQCHGFDGTMRNFGTPEHPEWVGTIAVEQPWVLFHKARFGNPGTPMPSWLQAGRLDQEMADIGRYAQVTFPVDCTSDEHCDDGLVCNGQETCVAGRCMPGTPPEPFSLDGYIGLDDFNTMDVCWSGPCDLPPCKPPVYDDACCVIGDYEPDGDVDLADFAQFQITWGHVPVPLKDYVGNTITLGSTAPYSGRQSCGDCHDVQQITNGFLFQMGRTDLAGNLIMHDDYFNDGRYWIKSPGRYGVWGQSFVYQLAAQHAANESEIEQGTFAWIRDCGSCHPGGGAGEYDRDGAPLYNEQTGQFGWQITGSDPALNGDYTDMIYTTGVLQQAPWNRTGRSGPDCMYCHRRDRTITFRAAPDFDGRDEFFAPDRGDMNSTWRKGVLAAGAALVDNYGNPVPAFAAAGTAGQGWFSTLDLTASPPKLQIDYAVGVTNGSLVADPNGVVALPPKSFARPPRDQVCVSCHPLATITGTLWFDSRDVMYRMINHLNDADPSNDIPVSRSTACNYCHRGNLNHNFAKGNSPQIQYRNEIDGVNLKSCRSCHLANSPTHDPNAPPYPGYSLIHQVANNPTGPMYKLSCQACHIPYALTGALVFRDITIPGATGTTARYYSADPLDPTDPDKSRWYPTFIWKTDTDGVQRIFPANLWINIYWANWDQNGTPDDLSDDIISPLLSWQIRQAIGPNPLPIVTDDNGDGQLEINRPEEILAYIERLKGNDSYGHQIAANPVLVRGYRVWYEDPEEPGGVNSFDHRGTGIPMTPYPYIWEMDHNALARQYSWGYQEGPEDACWHCHRVYNGNLPVPVFDRLILIDPYGPDGQPVYETVRQLTGVDPP